MHDKIIEMNQKTLNQLPAELRTMVKWSVAILGNVIEDRLGKRSFENIELVRQRMVSLRGAEEKIVLKELEKTFLLLKRLTKKEKYDFAKAYTLMLELMNACENAYRTFRLKKRHQEKSIEGAEAIYFVLTAHPTESRSPENIAVFHEIQKTLVEAFEQGIDYSTESLRSLLELAWQIEIVRMRKPRVQDEAEHVYSILLRDSNLSVLLDFGRKKTPAYIRSWVGGDKDGHPGVDEVVMTDSLQMSRDLLLKYVKKQLIEYRNLINKTNLPQLNDAVLKFLKTQTTIKKLKIGDASRVLKVHDSLNLLLYQHQKHFGKSLPLPLARLDQLFKIFPGMVVPLELREDSGVLMSDPSGDHLAIGRMLRKIGQFSKGNDPTFYARGMIISMAQSIDHIRIAGKMIKRQVGNSRIPVVPLFEQKEALDSGASIVSELLKDPKIRKIVQKDWGNVVEVMVGYSDSAKESGVISSRLAILNSIVAIDRACNKEGVKAVFFHGSGGSVDRGGGAIKDQIAGWPKNALNVYKATVQGEMVERTFASPEILESQLFQISENTNLASRGRYRYERNPELEKFADKTKKNYQTMITDPDFLKLVELATPYPYLKALKIGSRPTKRASSGLTVSGLRAIPWVLCWTQTRILFPTFWGIGSSWSETSKIEKKKLKESFTNHAVFRSYVHALGFTLAKIEMPVFEMYLKKSLLKPTEADKFILRFKRELSLTQNFFEEVTGKKDPMWYRPWLGESIELRAPMIHPLNILEILAQNENDLSLLRLTVAGIASGMLTTG